jgi:hypothetical protein
VRRWAVNRKVLSSIPVRGAKNFPYENSPAFWLTADKPQRPTMANMWRDRLSPDGRSPGRTRPEYRANAGWTRLSQTLCRGLHLWLTAGVTGARIGVAAPRLGESASDAYGPLRGTFRDIGHFRAQVCHPQLTGGLSSRIAAQKVWSSTLLLRRVAFIAIRDGHQVFAVGPLIGRIGRRNRLPHRAWLASNVFHDVRREFGPRQRIADRGQNIQIFGSIPCRW